ncbi:MAG TPA: flavodoxin domain-containing protein [Mycobacterium sp.]
MTTKVLLGYASADGSTAEVAERLGKQLRNDGLQVQVVPVTEQPDPSAFDVVVLGSAIHDGEFLPEFGDFVERHRSTLCQRPVWLFSLGMGPTLRGPIGAIFRNMVPPAIAAVRDRLGAVEYHPFGGKFDRPPERKLRMVIWLMGTRPGDHRDWAEIDDWATSIARSAAVESGTG